MIPPTSHSAAIAPATLPHVAEATSPHVAHNVDAPFAFASFEIDAGARQVRLHGAPVPVGARAFSLLLLLAERRDRVVGKDELLDLVWPGLVVAENNLSVQLLAGRCAAADLRRADRRMGRAGPAGPVDRQVAGGG